MIDDDSHASFIYERTSRGNRVGYSNRTSGDNKGFQTGMASEYLVLSMLYRQGFDAYLTLGNKKSVDIIIRKDDGSIVTIDVKSVRGYDSIPAGNIVGDNNHFVVVVIYRNKFEDVKSLPECYVVPIAVAMECQKTFAGNRIDIFRKDIEKYKDRWDLIKGGTL